MNRYILVALVLFCVCFVACDGQGRRRWGGRRVKGDASGGQADQSGGNTNKWRERLAAKRRQWKSKSKRWMSLKNSWKVPLPSGAVAEEVAFLRTGDNPVSMRGWQNMMWMMSRSDNLLDAGFQKSFTMGDFNAGLVAIRIELPDQEITTPTPSSGRRNWRQHMRFWKRKNHACFVFDADVSVNEASTELNTRNTSSIVPLGQEKTMYAQFQNIMTQDDFKGSSTARLCGQAALKNKAFRLVSTDDGMDYTSSFIVLGQIDASQPGKSVPLKILVDSNIDLGTNTQPLE